MWIDGIRRTQVLPRSASGAGGAGAAAIGTMATGEGEGKDAAAPGAGEAGAALGGQNYCSDLFVKPIRDLTPF